MILGGLALGCGLLVERVSGLPLPGALIAPTGLALIIVGANFTTATDLTAQLTVPLVVALAVAGFFLRGRAVRLNAWALASAVAAFAVYSAPIVLSG